MIYCQKNFQLRDHPSHLNPEWELINGIWWRVRYRLQALPVNIPNEPISSDNEASESEEDSTDNEEVSDESEGSN